MQARIAAELPAMGTGEAIEYQGKVFRLTKRYDDFETLKNDPNNIAPADYARVRKLIETAPVPEHCADFHEVLDVAFSLEFPGYGSGGLGDPHATDRLRVIGKTIEIPHADADRVLVYVKDDHGYRLADDTVFRECGAPSGSPDAASGPESAQPCLPITAEVTVGDGKVTYRTREGSVIAERPIRQSP
jgi:hypothetical protein